MPTRPKLAITTWDGFPDGMNLAIPAHEIKDSQARYLQDVWVYRTSLTDRRGPLEAANGVLTFTGRLVGMAWTLSPDGQVRIAAFHVTAGVLTMSVLSSDYSSSTDFTLPGSWSTSPYPLFDSKPRLNGGSWIGLATQDDVNPNTQILLQWRGANKVQYNPASVTVTQGSKNVTAPSGFTANVVPGMFLFTSGGAEFVGTVASVTSDTALVLEEPALHAIAAAGARFDAYMGWFPRVQKGVASVAAANASVTGANTKWKDQGVTSGHRLYRASDNLLVGTVLSVTSNTALTLTAGAAFALVEDDHFLVASAPDSGVSTLGTGSKVGFLNATYAEVQWYANRGITADQSGEFVNRLWFSDSADPQAVDLSTVDGDFIPVSSGKEANTPIKQIIPAYNSLMVLKERETFAVFGNNPDNFEVRKIAEDGTLSTMSAVPFDSGVIWAGREGIYFWDGVEAINIVEDTLGKYYHDLVTDFDPRTHRMWAVMHEDHYLLHIESIVSPVAVVKGNTSVTPSVITIAIYMPRRAVTVHNNLHVRASVTIPSTQGSLNWIGVNTASGGRICDLNTILSDDGIDSILCEGATIGPDLYVESKKYDIGNGMLKKLWKMLMLHYLVGGDSLKLDTVIGLNTVGSTTTSDWPITVYSWDRLAPTPFSTWDNLAGTHPTWDSLVDAIFFVKRIKFLKRSQYLAFRIYQNSADVNAAKLGPFALAYKAQRPGRV
jgi:hypothetical protein